MPKGASKDIEDFMLTRYACYLVAQMVTLVSRRLLLPKITLLYKHVWQR